MWSEIALERGPDGGISPVARARLMSRPEAEAEAAIAYVVSREGEMELLGADPARLEDARELFVEGQRVRELLRVRSYSLETERVWAGLPPEDRGAILGRLSAAGQPATSCTSRWPSPSPALPRSPRPRHRSARERRSF